MKPAIVISLVFLAIGWVVDALAGPNAGGVLSVHHDPQIVYTASHCDSLELPSECPQLNPTAPANGEAQLWFVVAAFPDSIEDRFSTVVFGLGSYNTWLLTIGDWGPCDLGGSPLEIPDDNWPMPNTGTAVSWSPGCHDGQMIPVYWFLTYAYGPTTLPLAPHPVQQSVFVDCGEPLSEDSIEDFGTMGFGALGQNPCPKQRFTLEGTWGSIQAGGE